MVIQVSFTGTWNRASGIHKDHDQINVSSTYSVTDVSGVFVVCVIYACSPLDMLKPPIVDGKVSIPFGL
jgi:hypothetical protein